MAMSLLIEDLAEETSAGNRRAAERLNREAQSANGMREQQACEAARQASAFAVSRLPQVEEVWRSALAALLKMPTGDGAERLLCALLDVFSSGQQLVRSCRALWDIASRRGSVPEELDELERADARLNELAANAKRALETRAGDWKPANPDRLALGLQLAREGKTVSADEARGWFRKRGG